MISLIISESALELVPYELEGHPSVISHARKLGKHSSEILLDNSWHFAAMKGIKNEIKRGRPDIVHFSILEATTIPLYLENKLNLFVHTIDDKVIHFGKNVHLPKSYHRFQGVIEKLYREKKIIAKNVVICIDPAAIMFLIGSEMDYKEEKFSSGFDFSNPNEIARCC